jgi:3-oxoacyl-[acyl-carrier protein] reductase
MTDALPTDVVEGWNKLIPLQRMGQTEDVANVALFLASDLGAYVNGQTISVCGGMLM